MIDFLMDNSLRAYQHESTIWFVDDFHARWQSFAKLDAFIDKGKDYPQMQSKKSEVIA